MRQMKSQSGQGYHNVDASILYLLTAYMAVLATVRSFQTVLQLDQSVHSFTNCDAVKLICT